MPNIKSKKLIYDQVNMMQDKTVSSMHIRGLFLCTNTVTSHLKPQHLTFYPVREKSLRLLVFWLYGQLSEVEI